MSDLDAAPLTIVRLNREGRITRVNEAWRRFARENGGDAATTEGVGLDYLSAVQGGPEDAATRALVALLEELMSCRRASFTHVYACHAPTEVRWFRLDAERIASDASIVIVHSNITEQQVAAGRLTVQAVVTHALAARAPLLETCHQLIEATCQSLAWDFGAIWVQGDDNRIKCVETWSAPHFADRSFAEVTLANSFEKGCDLAGRVWNSLSPEWVSNVSADRHFVRAPRAAAAGLRTGFAVPLGAEGEVFAVVEFFSRIERAPELALMELLTTSGVQLGGQVLRERAEQRAREAEAAERRTSLASKQNAERFRQILDAIPDLVLVKGPRSEILWGNTAFRDLYGMSNEQLQGLIDAPFNEPDYTLQYIRDDALVFSSGKMLEIPNEPVTRVDGSVRQMRTTKSPIFDEAGKVVMLVAVCRDITEQTRLEEHLRLADRMASVGTMAAGVAHEINTPIQFVSDSVHFLRDGMKDVFDLVEKLKDVQRLAADSQNPDLERAASIAAEAEESADLAYLRKNVPTAFERSIDGLERVSTIVRSMKEFAHPAQNEMAPVDLNRAIQSTLVISGNEYRYVAELETDFGDIPQVACYGGDINQVILNLIVNAAHAIADVVRGTDSRGKLTVRTYRDGDNVVISIGDTGAGIPEPIGKHIFEPFFTTKEVGKGTGQGLALAWGVVKEKHGGELRFETKLGEGTTFFVHLPILGKRRD